MDAISANCISLLTSRVSFVEIKAYCSGTIRLRDSGSRAFFHAVIDVVFWFNNKVGS